MRASGIMIACGLLVVGSAQAQEWSPNTQPYVPGQGCSAVNAPNFDSEVYGHRWDVVIPAGGGKPEVTVVLDPASYVAGPGYGSDPSDGEARVMAVRVADARIRALSVLMALHQRCGDGGQLAEDGCISLGQVVQAFDRLTDEGTNLRTYRAPRNAQGVFTEPRHYWWGPGESGLVSDREFFMRLAIDPLGMNRKWAIPDTAGAIALCRECRSSLNGYLGRASDYDVFSPRQIEEAMGEVLIGPDPGEFTLDEQGRIVVPLCQQ